MAPDRFIAAPSDQANGFPHERFTELRAAGPVHLHRSTELREDGAPVDFWSVVGHPEVQQANRDFETFSAADDVMIRGNPGPGNIVKSDPPHHTRLRRLISAGFTPRMIRMLDERISSRTAEILDAAAAKGECDFVADIAYQLPMHVIADIVGIPEVERPWVFERTNRALQAHDFADKSELEGKQTAAMELFGYAQELTARKRADPADDAWTLIAQAEVTDDDGTVHGLEGLELEMFFVILAIAGSETTRNALSQGLLALLAHPDQLEELRSRPEGWTAATDEIIRWASPVLFFGRSATRDTVLGGQEIKAGDRVVLWYPSANRDERAFVDPFRFDIHRHPNPHVSFGGGGPHFCLGANLAKLEINVLTSALLQRFDVELLGAPTWTGGGLLHNVGYSIDRLPVRLSPR